MTKSDFAPKTGRDRGGSNHTGQHFQKSDEYHPSKSRVSEMYIYNIHICISIILYTYYIKKIVNV